MSRIVGVIAASHGVARGAWRNSNAQILVFQPMQPEFEVVMVS